MKQIEKEEEVQKDNINLNKFFKAINKNDLVLTVNRRLAAYLQKNYDRHSSKQKA